MKFEEYYGRTLAKIAAGQPVDRELFDAAMTAYFALVGNGTSPKKARAIMDLYM